jgi:MFS family permease
LIASYILLRAAELHVWFFLLIGIIFGGIAALARPAIGAITAESVHSERQGSAFSLMQVAILVPGIVAPTLGGVMADHYGYPSVFPLGIALEVIVLVIVWRCAKLARRAWNRRARREVLVRSVCAAESLGFSS